MDSLCCCRVLWIVSDDCVIISPEQSPLRAQLFHRIDSECNLNRNGEIFDAGACSVWGGAPRSGASLKSDWNVLFIFHLFTYFFIFFGTDSNWIRLDSLKMAVKLIELPSEMNRWVVGIELETGNEKWGVNVIIQDGWLTWFIVIITKEAKSIRIRQFF